MSYKFRIVPYDLTQWKVEVEEKGTVQKRVYNSNSWTGQSKLVEVEEPKWVDCYLYSTGYLTTDRPHWSERTHWQRCIYNSKDEAKAVINMYLAKEKAADDRRKAVAKRLAETPPEVYE